jgi:signal recognition particle receptor subunit beta
MALFNYATKEITLKIVYYGPGLSGKTTNLQYLHSILNPENKGRLLSLSTEADRTLFFDFLPVELGKIRDFSIRFQLYTVPGQVRYNATRKVVLRGADAVVFVADSQRDMREQNIESFENMRENLLANNINPDEVPVVLQYNKRDLGNVLSNEDLNGDLNRSQYHVVEASAISGTGVEDSFRLITRLLLKHIAKKHQIEIQPQKEEEPVGPPPAVSEREETAVEEVAASSAPAAAPTSHAEKVQEPRPKEAIGEKEREPVSSPPAVSEKEETAVEEVAASSAPAAAPTYDAPKVQEWGPKEEEVREEDISTAGPRRPTEPGLSTKELKEDMFPTAEREAKRDETTAKLSSATEIARRVTRSAAGPEKAPVSPQAGVVPLMPAEKMERLVEEMSNITGLLTDLKNSVYVLSKEMKDLKEAKKEQEETNRILREIFALFQRLQTKKSWFRF